MVPLDLIVAGGMALVAADVATWCFKAAAQEQRQLRHDVRRREHQRRNEIERDTRRRLAQKAYEQRGAWLDMLTESMDTVWDMRKKTRSLKRQFQGAVHANHDVLKESALTVEQQRAIRDCNFHLERGIARLDAYAGPYIQQFIEEIKDAKRCARNSEFIEPEMPNATLPNDFPSVGDHLQLTAKESIQLRKTNRIEIGAGEFGRFYPTADWNDQSETIDVFVSDYDRNKSEWVISPAKGRIASIMQTTDAIPIDATLYAHRTGGCQAVWHSPFAESITLFLPYALADDAVKSAPWGTQVKLYVQDSDYRCRSITAGQTPRPIRDDSGLKLNLQVRSKDSVNRFSAALKISSDTFWVRDEDGQTIRLRLVTGEEFGVLDPDGDELVIGNCVGQKLGNTDGDICKSQVELAINSSPDASADSIPATDFLDYIRSQLDEQAEIRHVFNEESLETRKYQLLLEAEMEASKKESRKSIRFAAYSIVDESKPRIEVLFQADERLCKIETNMAVEVATRTTSIQGFVIESNSEANQLRCSFPRQRLADFRNREVLTTEPIVGSVVDSDLNRQVRALEQFRNVSFLNNRSGEEQTAFRMLRRTMLGLPIRDSQPSKEISPDAEGYRNLNANQQTAVRMILSDQPLSMILGPPGTGKTDTIAVALEAYIRRHPDARIAVVSQANVAVCEALHKLKSRFPECNILRHASAHAMDSLGETSKELTQEKLKEEFLARLEATEELPTWAMNLRESFSSECEDQSFLKHRVMRVLSASASVYGCTLSVLGRLASGSALFDLVVIDEAAKASLPECMIAAISAKRLVLVGDHHQLLPFLDERILDRAGDKLSDRKQVEDLWNRSLFMRMWENASDESSVQLLTQYRSRSAIREATSHLFYDDVLLPGRSDESQIVPYKESLVWVDTMRLGKHRRAKSSLVNEDEANCVLATIKMLAESLPNPSKATLAVICFYGAQKNLIARLLSESSEASTFASCEARTVDASQGGQWDIVILSITRRSGATSFVGNANRLNVSLSRAKDLAVIVGDFQFCLRDRKPDSCLGEFARYVQSKNKKAIRICAPTKTGTIARNFGIRVARPASKQRRRKQNDTK